MDGIFGYYSGDEGNFDDFVGDCYDDDLEPSFSDFGGGDGPFDDLVHSVEFGGFGDEDGEVEVDYEHAGDNGEFEIEIEGGDDDDDDDDDDGDNVVEFFGGVEDEDYYEEEGFDTERYTHLPPPPPLALPPSPPPVAPFPRVSFAQIFNESRSQQQREEVNRVTDSRNVTVRVETLSSQRRGGNQRGDEGNGVQGNDVTASPSRGKGDLQKKENGGTASSSGGKEWDKGDLDGVSCPICMDLWTSDGEHFVCCLPCGHLYGMSCIKTWLQQSTPGKCPQCCKECELEDVRRVYGSRIAVVEKELAERIKSLEAKCASLELKEADWCRKEAEWRRREAALRLELTQLEMGTMMPSQTFSSVRRR